MNLPTRYPDNPILIPDRNNPWESEASFNGCVIREGDTWHMVYRAQGAPQKIGAAEIPLSTIGHAISNDGVRFRTRRQFIRPYFSWEQFGCEDPRITKIGDTYYIFYTALSVYPFAPQGIHVGVALTKDFETILGKHQVTTFNSKAMALFPEKINGKFAALITAHTDLPPSKIGLIYFDHEYDIWSTNVWDRWYASLDEHVIPLLRNANDQIEIGAPPVKTDAGWLIVYCYIYDYRGSNKVFGIEAALLDAEHPEKILGRTSEPILVPQKQYELYGIVPNVIFPSGAIVDDNTLRIYYGAADTTCCIADFALSPLIDRILHPVPRQTNATGKSALTRFEGNPIISPNPSSGWESKLTFNPGAVFLGNRVHLLYRAMGGDDTSVLGYASSEDGVHITEKLNEPVYAPREPFEQKLTQGNSGCEDPRITAIEDKLVMLYTAFDGRNSPRVALTSISQSDFLQKRWTWEKPRLISPPVTDDKDACLFPEKIQGKYWFLHRFNRQIWIDSTDDLLFISKRYLSGDMLFSQTVGGWDNDKIGIGPPPIKTDDGWLLIYHGISLADRKYRLGAALLHREDPTLVLSRLDEPILVPEQSYEESGFRPGTVFSCGAAVIGDRLFVYYGSGDQTSSVASIRTADLTDALLAR